MMPQHRPTREVKIFLHMNLPYELIKHVKRNAILTSELINTIHRCKKCDVPTRCCPMVLRMYVFNLRNALNDRCAENSVPGITPRICTTLENSRNISNRSFSRLSQSRSHGFLVWCGRTRRKYDRASRSLSRYALKSSTCEQANHSRTLSPSFLEQTCTLIRAHDENSRTQFLLGFENLAVDFVIKNLATREKLSPSGVSR